MHSTEKSARALQRYVLFFEIYDFFLYKNELEAKDENLTHNLCFQ